MKSKVEIKVQGYLDNKWKDWFEGMELNYGENTTIISGKIKDDSFMYGILNKIRDLNLKLISVNPSE